MTALVRNSAWCTGVLPALSSPPLRGATPLPSNARSRYRDLSHSSLHSQILFHAPVFWRADAIQASGPHFSVDPSTISIEIMRNPLLGVVTHFQFWLTAKVCLVAAALAGTLPSRLYRNSLRSGLGTRPNLSHHRSLDHVHLSLQTHDPASLCARHETCGVRPPAADPATSSLNARQGVTSRRRRRPPSASWSQRSGKITLLAVLPDLRSDARHDHRPCQSPRSRHRHVSRPRGQGCTTLASSRACAASVDGEGPPSRRSSSSRPGRLHHLPMKTYSSVIRCADLAVATTSRRHPHPDEGWAAARPRGQGDGGMSSFVGVEGGGDASHNRAFSEVQRSAPAYGRVATLAARGGSGECQKRRPSKMARRDLVEPSALGPWIRCCQGLGLVC